MKKTNNLITINGNHYDAITGQPVAPGAARQAKSMDGVVRGSLTVAQPHKPAAPAAQHHSDAKPAPQSAAKPRSVARHGRAPKAHPSSTLMRQAVHKPDKPLHLSGLRAVASVDVLAPPADVTVMPKSSYVAVDPRREARAKRVAKSKFISRFGDVAPPRNLHITPAAIPVAATAPPTARPIGRQHSMDIFEQAMHQATSHKQTPPSHKAHATVRRRQPKSRRLASISTAALAVLIIGGFLAYQNVANVTVRMAAARAGFAASLPGYKPSGFSVGKFAYSPGHVTINFHSNSDDRHFALVEQPSNWDSATLLNDFVASAAGQYQTVQTAGRTLYIYGDNSATWVANGVWYRVQTNNSLSTTQLVNLASSI